MPKINFKSEELKRHLAVARIVKPETKDLSFTFSDKYLTIFSFDNRRYACSRIPLTDHNIEDGWNSSEFYITLDRISLFESELTDISITVNDQSLTIVATDGEQSRKASLKKRSIKSRRPSVPRIPNVDFIEVNTKDFVQLLNEVSCSAQVKETKTEEEMRINQVHFYPDSGHAISKSRYFGSISHLDGMSLDVSIVSNDIPLIKSFCSKITSDVVKIGSDKSRHFILDPVTNSTLSLSKISSKRPNLSLIDDSKFQTILITDKDQLLKNLGWAQTAIEGTQRIKFKAHKVDDNGIGKVVLYNGNEEISNFTTTFNKGDSIDADFPVRYLYSIVRHVDGDVAFAFHHQEMKSVLGIFSATEEKTVKSTHYISSMVSR